MVCSTIIFFSYMTMKTYKLDREENRKHDINSGAKEIPGAYNALVLNNRYDIKDVSKLVKNFIKEHDKRWPVKRDWIDKLFGLKSLKKQAKYLVIEFVDGDEFYARNGNTDIEFPEGHKYRMLVTGQFVLGRKCVVAAKNATLESPNKLGWTALNHELNHWALLVKFGNADADHEHGTEYGEEWTPEHSIFVDEQDVKFR